MVDIARLQIKIDSDGINTAGRRLADLGKRGRQVGKTLTTRLTLPLVAGMAGAVYEAGQLEGALDKFNVVFAGMNEEMMQFVNTFNQEFPISRRETIQSAAAMQDLLVPMGIAREQATEMTQDWLELAGALSAFNDVPMDRALTAIRSGIAGMSEPMRQFGIDARQVVLEQIALEEGLIAAGDAMTTQVRQQALLIQATKQSADAIGGLEEQKGSLLWIIGELKRDVKDLAADLGMELLPVVKDMLSSSKGWMEVFKDLDPEMRKIIISTSLLAAATGPVLIAISLMGSGLGVITRGSVRAAGAMARLNALMLAHPYLAVASAVALLGAAIGTGLVRDYRKGRSEIEEMSQGVKDQTKAFRELRKSMDDISPDRLSNRYMSLISRQEELNEKINSMSSVFDGIEISNEFFSDMSRMGMSSKEISEWQKKGRLELNLSRTELQIINGQMDAIREQAESNLALETQILRSKREQLIHNKDLTETERRKLVEYNQQIEANAKILEQRRQMREEEQRGLLPEAPPRPHIVEPLRNEMNRLINESNAMIDSAIKRFQKGLDLSVNVEIEPFFEPGSIGYIEQAIANLDRQITATTDEEARKRMQIRRDEYQEMLSDMGVATEETNQAAQDLGFTFSSAFEDAILDARELNDLLSITEGLLRDVARIFIRSTITKPLGEGLADVFGDIDFSGGQSVDDALITKDGRVIDLHPNDNVLAFQGQRPPVGASTVNVNVSVENNSSGADVEIKKSRSPSGDINLRAIVKDVNKDLFNSGEMDRTIQQFGVKRKPINRG